MITPGYRTVKCKDMNKAFEVMQEHFKECNKANSFVCTKKLIRNEQDELVFIYVMNCLTCGYSVDIV